ncbi:MAG: DUF5659 domain-containing protein [Bacillota bacterium]|nr:DUF5659 domain-containing protein [Bacillota bacterium]
MFKENKIKFVKTQKLAGWLMFQGFHFLRSDSDRNNPSKAIYIFEYKEGIEDEINNYKNLFGRK